tara:strand:+ start:1253 stop:1405 length:153 start_codon:yes stop_codon:yes gene_type:complete
MFNIKKVKKEMQKAKERKKERLKKEKEVKLKDPKKRLEEWYAKNNVKIGI